MPTSQLNAKSARNQVRIELRHTALARLIELQGQAVATGRRKPSYSELIEALIAQANGIDVITLLDGAGEGEEDAA